VISNGKMKKVNIDTNINPVGTEFCRKSGNGFIQDTISRIGQLQDHVEKAGMQIANAMARSLFMKTDRSGGNDV
jgi:hypothetical protein